jgi:phosphoribosylamine--glycine ligase
VKTLLVGSGAREHALAWRLAGDPAIGTLVAAPGNPGIAEHARCLPIAATDVEGLVRVARDEAADLVVVGPEAPLVIGLADRLRAAGIAVCGPSAAAARLEGSKAFAKEFMLARGIPTAEAAVFTDPDAARAHVRAVGAPIVIKADGLAAGKGVVVAGTELEALAAIDRMMRSGALGDAGRRVLVERCMTGEEASVFILTDGERFVLLPTAEDHKRLGDGDTGPNTGGMGAFAPSVVLDRALLARTLATIVEPTLLGLRELGIPYRGFLYVGLMIEEGVPRVVEYNARLGDPEAQVVLPLIASGFGALVQAAARGDLPARAALAPPAAGRAAAACVVLAAPGYPESPATGAPIHGLAERETLARDGVLVFHAGTKRLGDELVTAGGRVLGVTGVDQDIAGALARAYRAADAIHFDGRQMRRDIGMKALARRA